ncbi:MAG: glycosyltransferase family 39 protein [Myxococcota bacterium]
MSMPELWSWEAASGSIEQLLWAARLDRHPPLHVLLVWLSRRVSDSEALARLPFALGTLGAAVGLFGILRREVGAPWGLWGALALALSPMWIHHVGIMRPYGLMIACGVGLLCAALVLPDRPRRGAIGFVVFGVAGMYLHYLMVAPLGAALLGAGLGSLQRPPDARRAALFAVVASGLIVVACFAPWLWWTWRDVSAKSVWGAPSTAVFRYLAFQVKPLTSFSPLLLGLLAAVGITAAVRERRAALLGLAVGALLLPYLLSISLEVRLRVYVFISFLPWLIFFAALGARRWAGPRAWGVALVLASAPEAWGLLRLPSAPLGVGQSGQFDAGVHDTRREMAMLTAMLPEGTRLVIPDTFEPSIVAHYAPEATRFTPQTSLRSNDWVMRQPGDAASPRPGGCALTEAFVLTLHLPDEASCARVLDAIESAPHPTWLIERAMQSTAPGQRQALLTAAGEQTTSPIAHRALARDLAEANDPAAATAAYVGLWRSMQWNDRETAQDLLRLLTQRAAAAGDLARADTHRQQEACLQRAIRDVWLPHRCLWPFTAATVRQKPTPKRRRPPQRRSRGR